TDALPPVKNMSFAWRCFLYGYDAYDLRGEYERDMEKIRKR
ncbi:unnamed protein product, partial [marine sediment metagenome]